MGVFHRGGAARGPESGGHLLKVAQPSEGKAASTEPGAGFCPGLWHQEDPRLSEPHFLQVCEGRGRAPHVKTLWALSISGTSTSGPAPLQLG